MNQSQSQSINVLFDIKYGNTDMQSRKTFEANATEIYYLDLMKSSIKKGEQIKLENILAYVTPLISVEEFHHKYKKASRYYKMQQKKLNKE
jgi:hypothetical protein